MWEKFKAVKNFVKPDKRERIELNQTYTDKPRERIVLDSSFHSDLNHSLGDIDNERLDSFNSLNGIPTKVNISSVLNNPKKLSWVNEVLNVIQDTLGDEAIGNYGQVKPIRTMKEHINIQASDFDGYIKKISKALETYKKNNIIKIQKQKEKENINLNENLIKCYKTVPPFYFDEKFLFNFENLNRDALKMSNIQEDLTLHLDLVEMNLFYQITSRFKEFLDVILKLNEMEKQIDNCLKNIQFFRINNKMLKEKLCSPSIKILLLKRKKINIEKTLHMLDLMKLVQDTIPTMEKLIHNNNFETAVNLIRESEEIYMNTLKPVISMRNCNLNFRNGRDILENTFRKEFQDRCLAYIIQALAYTKTSINNTSLDTSSLDESSLVQVFNILKNLNGLSVTIDALENSIDITDKDRMFIQLPWSIVESSRNEKLENTLAKLIIENIKIREIRLVGYRANLIESLKKFNLQFNKDLQEFVDSLNITNQYSQTTGNGSGGSGSNISSGGATSDILSKIPISLYIKFLEFYTEISKRLISRQLNLNKYIMECILDYYNKNYIDLTMFTGDTIPLDENGESLRRLDPNSIKIFSESIDEFYGVLAGIIKFFLNQMSEMINKIRYENITLQEFYKLVAVIEDIRNYFDNDIKINQVLTSWYKTDKPKLRMELNKLTGNVLDKISVTSLLNLKTQCEKSFIESYHKIKMANLMSSLSSETWIPVDIPDKYLDYFGIFFDSQAEIKNNNGINGDNMNNGEILKDAKDNNIIDEISKEDKSELSTEEEKNESVKKVHEKKEITDSLKNKTLYILKNEIYVNGKRYRATSSFLLLIKIIYDYLSIAQKFRLNGPITLNKLFEIIKYYNSFTCQLILGAGAIPLGVIKTITAKILGMRNYRNI